MYFSRPHSSSNFDPISGSLTAAIREEMKLQTLAQLLHTGAVTGAGQALQKERLLKAEVSAAEAIRRYGRSQLDRWQREGLIAPHSASGNSRKKVFDRQRLEAIAASSNRCTYLPVADRQVL